MKRYRDELYNDYDNILIDRLVSILKTNREFATKLQEQLQDFKINPNVLKQLEIVDPITKKAIEDPCMTTCCGTLFDKCNLATSININNDRYYCSFCKHEIIDRNAFAYNDIQLMDLHEQEFVFNPVFNTDINYMGQTKIQFIKDIIDSQITNASVDKKSKILVYMTDKINIFDVVPWRIPTREELTKWHFEDKDELIALIKSVKSVGICYY